jgi:hypothetical protein
MFGNFDLVDKLNIIYFYKYFFSFNFIAHSNILVRLTYIKKENNFKFIDILNGLEYWSNNKVFIKKIGFFYKLKIMVIDIFFKTYVLNFVNWLYY